METKENLIFNRYELNENLSPEQMVKELKTHIYTDVNGLGFTTIRIEDDVIEANLIIRTPTFIKVYNPIDGTFNSNVIYVFDEIEIFIDAHLSIIYTTAPTTKFNKAKTLLRSSIKSKITYMNIDFTPVNVLKMVESLNLKPYVTDLTIKKFRYKEGAYGRYTVHIEELSIGKELIDIYKDAVTRVTMKVESSVFSVFVMSISAQNSFTLKSDEADFWSIVNLLKEHI